MRRSRRRPSTSNIWSNYGKSGSSPRKQRIEDPKRSGALLREVEDIRQLIVQMHAEIAVTKRPMSWGKAKTRCVTCFGVKHQTEIAAIARPIWSDGKRGGERKGERATSFILAFSICYYVRLDAPYSDKLGVGWRSILA